MAQYEIQKYSDKDIADKLKTFFTTIDWNSFADQRYFNGYTTYFNFSYHDFLINCQELKELRNLIFSKLDDNLTFDSIWCTRMGENSFHKAHDHAGQVVSGTFYVSLPDNSSPIVFKDDDKYVEYNVQEGDLLLWPADVIHGVPLNKSTTFRETISFNLNSKVETNTNTF